VDYGSDIPLTFHLLCSSYIAYFPILMFPQFLIFFFCVFRWPCQSSQEGAGVSRSIPHPEAGRWTEGTHFNSIHVIHCTHHSSRILSPHPCYIPSPLIPSLSSPHPSACHQEESNHCRDEGARQSAHNDPHFGRIGGHWRGHIRGVRTHHGQGGCYGVSRIQEPFKVEVHFQTLELICRILTHRFPHPNGCDIPFTRIISLQPLLFITSTFFS
jgi:hypothetical protein